jgi:PAS domain S-box-containing protein
MRNPTTTSNMIRKFAPPDILTMLSDVLISSTSETVVITDGNIHSDVGPTIQFVNLAATISTGFGYDELVGYPLSKLWANATKESVINSLHEAAQSRAPVLNVVQSINRAGKTVWLEIRTTPIFDARGDLSHMVRFGRDVTDRKNSELYRESTQKLLASVFGVINVPLLLADDSANIIMANTAVTRTLGWSIFDLMGKPVTKVLAEADQEPLTALMTSAEALDQTRHVGCLLQCKGKPELAGEIELTTVLQADGRHYHILMLRPQMDAATEAREWNLEMAVREATRPGGAAPVLVAGKLQLVGLQEIREAMGEKWQATAERAFATAERIIQRHIRPGDIFRRSADDGYLVLFSNLSETEAQFKARAIADEIREKLTGEISGLTDTAVSAITGKVAVDAASAKSEETIIEAIERHLKAERAQVEARSIAKMESGLRMEKAITTATTNHLGKASPITFVRLPAALQEATDSLAALGDKRYGLEAEIFMLAGAGERVLASISQNASELIVVPVRLSTLTRHKDSEAWLSVARALGDACKRQIVVEVRGMPRDIAQSRITDLVMRLSSMFKSVAFEVPVVDPAFIAMIPPPVRLLSVDAKRIAWGPNHLPSSLFTRLVKALDVKQKRLVVRNPARETVDILAKSGPLLYLHESR